MKHPVAHDWPAPPYRSGMTRTTNQGEIPERLDALKDEIGRRLRQAREQAGLTLEQVAEKMDRSRASVGHWETGRNHLNAAELAFLALLYRTSAGWLLTGDASAPASAAERRLLTAFRGMDPSDRRYIAETIEDRLRRRGGAGLPFKSAGDEWWENEPAEDSLPALPKSA